MSRSYKKHPITGMTTAESEKYDKQLANRKLRRKQKNAIRTKKEVLPQLKEVSNNYTFNKDGKHNWKGTDYETKAKRK
jgi:hypothetical protein